MGSSFSKENHAAVLTSEGCPVTSIIGVPIGKPIYLKSASDPTLYLQVEDGTPQGNPSSVENYTKLMFRAKPEAADDSRMWWLAVAMSASSFSLKHIDSGFFVECFRGGNDLQGTLHLRSGIPLVSRGCLEFIVRKHYEVIKDDHAPFGLECQYMKSLYNATPTNRKIYFVDERLVDWPRVGPGVGGWLIGGVEHQRGEQLRCGGHIFLWEKIGQCSVVTLCLQTNESGQVCNCSNFSGEEIAQHRIVSTDTVADIRSKLLTQLQEGTTITDVALVTSNGVMLEVEDDPKALLDCFDVDFIPAGKSSGGKSGANEGGKSGAIEQALRQAAQLG